MPTGTQLSTLRQMLYAECGEEMNEAIAPGLKLVYNQLLNNQQSFLDNQHAYLRGKVLVGLQGVVGQQYYTIPGGIDFDRLEQPIFTNVASFRYRIGYGIGQEEYNLYRSELGVTASPVMKWQIVTVGGTPMIELWPIPSVPQIIEFTGLLPITQMVNDTDTCVIDDLVLVLFTAAERLQRQQKADAQAKATKASLALAGVRAGLPSRFEVWNISGQAPRFDGFYKGNDRRPVVAVNVGNPQ